MIPNELYELYDMALKLSLKDKIQFCQDLLSYIERDTSTALDKLVQREVEIMAVLKLTNDEIVKNIFREDE